MRKEYRAYTYTQVFNAIDDFFSNSQITPLYTLIDSQNDRRVYHNISENLDLIFYHPDDMVYQNNNNVILLVTTQYDSNVDVFFLPDVVCNGENHNKVNNITNLVYYFPAPTLVYDNTETGCNYDRLIINFNSELSTFMISWIRVYEIDYTFTDQGVHNVRRTSSICFGMVDKTLDFDGGFFYGGDFVYTYERTFRENSNGVLLADYTYCLFDSECNDLNVHISAYNGSWVGDTYNYYDYRTTVYYTNSVSNPHNVNRFDAFLRANIDYAPMRKRDDEVKPPDNDPADPTKPYFVNAPPVITRNQTWAVTMDLDYYVPMVCSITNSEKALPKYTPLLSVDYLHRGRAINTNNKMSLVMPLWFMVRRDPQELEDYSYAGKNEVINYVNMRYMDTDRMIESSFPSQEQVNKYNCFQMGSRRAFFGMKGYSGLAFKIEEEDDYSPAPNLDLLNLTEMERHRVSDSVPLLNIDVGDESGYGGDTEFDDMPEGSFILKRPYTDYSSITFKFCDDAGTVTDTVIWTQAQLTNALNGTNSFNLLPANSPVTWHGNPGEWLIFPFSGGSTSTKFLCDSQNCGLIGIKGNP